MRKLSLFKTTLLSFTANIAYGLGNLVFGICNQSEWLFVIGIYYLLLSIMRYTVLLADGRIRAEQIRRFTAIMLIILSLVLVFVVIFSFIKDRGTRFHEIIMITIALYTFTKITLAIINMVKTARLCRVPAKCLRSISLADAAVSIFALQRSMLVSFGEMMPSEIKIFNAATGTAVYVFVFLTGLNLLISKK